MARTVGIGIQNFEKIRQNQCFYIDKTKFIKEWWERRDDVMLEPLKLEDDAMILEFKVFQPRKENDLEETARAALTQIKEKQYAAALVAKGISAERIRKYGFAFEGRKVLIWGGR